jgi:type I restriction enzyme M protein
MSAEKKKKGAPSPRPSPARGEGVKSEGRWRSYNYDELVSHDKASLDIFWLKDESLEASDNLPDPDVIALEIVEDLEAALEQFREIATDLASRRGAESAEKS